MVVISQHGLLGSSPEPVFSPCSAGEAEVMHAARWGAIAVSLMQPLIDAILGGFLMLQVAARPCTTCW